MRFPRPAETLARALDDAKTSNVHFCFVFGSLASAQEALPKRTGSCATLPTEGNSERKEENGSGQRRGRLAHKNKKRRSAMVRSDVGLHLRRCKSASSLSQPALDVIFFRPLLSPTSTLSPHAFRRSLCVQMRIGRMKHKENVVSSKKQPSSGVVVCADARWY